MVRTIQRSQRSQGRHGGACLLALALSLGLALPAGAQPRAPMPDADTSSVDRFFTTVARVLPLSPILFPVGNEVSVEDWIQSCLTSSEGWTEDLTCYGGGLPRPVDEPARAPGST